MKLSRVLFVLAAVLFLPGGVLLLVPFLMKLGSAAKRRIPHAW